jgi:hypothetical protein
MKRVSMLLLLLALYVQPARAGHGTIEETDTEIFVEYTSDPSDKPVDAGKPAAAALTQGADPARPGSNDAVLVQPEGARRQEAGTRMPRRSRTRQPSVPGNEQ